MDDTGSEELVDKKLNNISSVFY